MVLLSRLPELLRHQGLGLDLCGIYITCLLSLDDVAILCKSEAQVRVALRVAHQFGEEAKIAYSLVKGKSGVIPFNVLTSPPTRSMGEG